MMASRVLERERIGWLRSRKYYQGSLDPGAPEMGELISLLCGVLLRFSYMVGTVTWEAYSSRWFAN